MMDQFPSIQNESKIRVLNILMPDVQAEMGTKILKGAYKII